jgi:hypothetical protein
LANKTVVNDVDEALAAALFKLESAVVFLQDMANDLFPKETQEMRAIRAGTGALALNRWQATFWAHLDAFMVALNSVPDVITSWCGLDQSRRMKSFYASLLVAEIDRRKNFDQAFKAHRRNFIDLALREARNVSVHRTGTPPVEVAVVGRFGVHIGGPIQLIPSSETRQIVAGDDPALQLLAASELPSPIEPKWSDFELITPIGRLPLEEELKKYLTAAKDLIAEARQIYKTIHATNPITCPPSI